MGKTLSKPKQRYQTSDRRTPPAPSHAIPSTALSMPQYRALARDSRAGQPFRQQGDVGSYWTVPVSVPLSELTGVRATVFNIGRLFRVRTARQEGITLPPIQLGVSRHGYVWVVDGNHRLTEARESGQPVIRARFTFGGS